MGARTCSCSVRPRAHGRVRVALRIPDTGSQEGKHRWDEAEQGMRDLMVRHPTWVEPRNQLATLLYGWGRYTESLALCDEVIAAKPWHFGALSGVVMCHSQLGDLEAASRCAEAIMPPFGGEAAGGGAGRRAWVDQQFAARQRDAQ